MSSRRLSLSDCLEGVIARLIVCQKEGNVAEPGIPVQVLCAGLFQLSADPRFASILQYLDFERIVDHVFSQALEEWLFMAGVWRLVTCTYRHGQTEVVMTGAHARSVCDRLRCYRPHWQTIDALAQELLQCKKES